MQGILKFLILFISGNDSNGGVLMIKRLRNNKGMTLIEMLVVIAIIGVVYTLVGSFFKVSEVVYKEGQEQTVEQHATRIATDLLASQLRNADTIQLFADTSSLSGYDDYYYIDSNQLIYDDGTNQVAKTQADLAGATDIPPGLGFDITGSSDIYFLEFTVTGSDGFELVTKIRLNNIDDDAMSGVATTGRVIGITKP